MEWNAIRIYEALCFAVYYFNKIYYIYTRFIVMDHSKSIY